jgi:hypothetical protein
MLGKKVWKIKHTKCKRKEFCCLIFFSFRSRKGMSATAIGQYSPLHQNTMGKCSMTRKRTTTTTMMMAVLLPPTVVVVVEETWFIGFSICMFAVLRTWMLERVEQMMSGKEDFELTGEWDLTTDIRETFFELVNNLHNHQKWLEWGIECRTAFALRDERTFGQTVDFVGRMLGNILFFEQKGMQILNELAHVNLEIAPVKQVASILHNVECVQKFWSLCASIASVHVKFRGFDLDFIQTCTNHPNHREKLYSILCVEKRRGNGKFQTIIHRLESQLSSLSSFRQDWLTLLPPVVGRTLSETVNICVANEMVAAEIAANAAHAFLPSSSMSTSTTTTTTQTTLSESVSDIASFAANNDLWPYFFSTLPLLDELHNVTFSGLCSNCHFPFFGECPLSYCISCNHERESLLIPTIYKSVPIVAESLEKRNNRKNGGSDLATILMMSMTPSTTTTTTSSVADTTTTNTTTTTVVANNNNGEPKAQARTAAATAAAKRKRAAARAAAAAEVTKLATDKQHQQQQQHDDLDDESDGDCCKPPAKKARKSLPSENEEDDNNDEGCKGGGRSEKQRMREAVSNFKRTIKKFFGHPIIIDEKIKGELFNDLDQYFRSRTDIRVPDHIEAASLPLVNGKRARTDKQYMYQALQATQWPGFYDHVTYLCFMYWGTPIKPVSKAFFKGLVDDFHTYRSIFETAKSQFKRKSTLNTQFVLYKLLKKNGYPVSESDFKLVVTDHTRDFHEKAWTVICQVTGWPN